MGAAASGHRLALETPGDDPASGPVLHRALAHGAAVSLRKLLCATRGFHGEVRGLVDASYPPRMTPLGNDVPEEEESEHDDDY